MRVPGNISVAAAICRARRDNAMKDLRSLEEHMNDLTKKVAGVYPEAGEKTRCNSRRPTTCHCYHCGLCPYRSRRRPIALGNSSASRIRSELPGLKTCGRLYEPTPWESLLVALSGIGSRIVLTLTVM